MRKIHTHRFLLFVVALLVLFMSNSIKASSAEAVEGRWDLIIDSNGKPLPSWLEIEHSGIKILVGRFTAILSGTSVDNCSHGAAKDLLQVSKVYLRTIESVRTLLQRDPSFARTHASPPLRMTFS